MNQKSQCYLEAYATVKMNSRPWNFSWFVDGKLAAMAYPYDRDIPFLAASGLKTVINLTQYPVDYQSTADDNGITVHDICMEDFAAPEYDQILQVLDILTTSATVSA